MGNLHHITLQVLLICFYQMAAGHGAGIAQYHNGIPFRRYAEHKGGRIMILQHVGLQIRRCKEHLDLGTAYLHYLAGVCLDDIGPFVLLHQLTGLLRTTRIVAVLILLGSAEMMDEILHRDRILIGCLAILTERTRMIAVSVSEDPRGHHDVLGIHRQFLQITLNQRKGGVVIVTAVHDDESSVLHTEDHAQAQLISHAQVLIAAVGFKTDQSDRGLTHLFVFLFSEQCHIVGILYGDAGVLVESRIRGVDHLRFADISSIQVIPHLPGGELCVSRCFQYIQIGFEFRLIGILCIKQIAVVCQIDKPDNLARRAIVRQFGQCLPPHRLRGIICRDNQLSLGSVSLHLVDKYTARLGEGYVIPRSNHQFFVQNADSVLAVFQLTEDGDALLPIGNADQNLLCGNASAVFHIVVGPAQLHAGSITDRVEHAAGGIRHLILRRLANDDGILRRPIGNDGQILQHRCDNSRLRCILAGTGVPGASLHHNSENDQ